MTVRGLQLMLPGDGVPAAAAAKLLAGPLAVEPKRPATRQQTFWDTFDGRLHAAELTLVSDTGASFTLLDAQTGEEVAAATVDGGPPSRHLLSADLPAGALRDRVAPVIDMRALSTVARVRSRLVPVDVVDGDGKIVVRLCIEEAAALVTGARRVPLRTRLHVSGVRGYDREFDRVVRTLTGKLGFVAAIRPLYDDAIAATGHDPEGTSSKLRIALDGSERADAAAVMILRRLLEIVDDNMAGTLADVDTEFLHDLRVAVRRSRSLQRELKGVFPPEPLRVFRDGFRELQAITGPTRDLDVQLLEFDELTAGLEDGVAHDVAPLRDLLAHHLRQERATMERKLRSERTRALLHNWAAFLDTLVEAPEDDRPDAARPIADVAGERIGSVYRVMVKQGSKIDDESPAEALHDLRKKGKELRYLLEFFSSLYPESVVKPMVATLKRLQDVLGRFQDREVQADRLRELGDDVAQLEGGAPALMAMGVLVQRLGEDQGRARAEFATRFADFSAKRQRTLVKRTFA